MRNNQSFLNRVSFRRRTPTRGTPTIASNNVNTNTNMKSVSNTTINAMRSCMDVSDTVSITPPASIILPLQEGSSSGKNFLFLNN